MVEEVQSRANAIANLLDDINVNLEVLGEQKAVIDHVGEKLARLDFMVQEAQNTLRALQREREVAERIEQSIKTLRARGGGADARRLSSARTRPSDEAREHSNVQNTQRADAESTNGGVRKEPAPFR